MTEEKSLNSLGRFSTQAPSAYTYMAPRSTPFTPSVKMSEGTPMTATPQPLMRPTRAPMRMPTANATSQLQPSRRRLPTTVATKPRLEPTETSISPTMMAKAMPTAIRIYTTAELKHAEMLSELAKVGLMRLTMMNSTIRNKKLLSSRAFKAFFNVLMPPPSFHPSRQRRRPSDYPG